MAAKTEMRPQANAGAVVQRGGARFTVLTPELIRLEYSRAGAFEDRASFSFIHRDLPVPAHTVAEDRGVLAITTSSLRLTYRDDGKPFHAGNLAIELLAPVGPPTRWVPGMPDSGNLRGTTRTLDDVNGACALEPGLISRDGWALHDDSKRPVFEPGAWPWAASRRDAEAIDWYFFGYGHDFRRALYDFTRVAGPVPLPPRYVFGAWWSRYWAYTEQEFRDLVGEFEQHDVPLDVLVVDMDWHLDGWTGYTWDPRYFPAPERFLAWAHDKGLRVTLNLHPHDGVGPHEAAYARFVAALGLDPATRTAIPFDCVSREYVDAYFRLLHHPLERIGVDFWWMDWQQGRQTTIPGVDPLFWLNYLHWTDWERNPERAAERPLIFSRWGGLGNHRYQIGFSGDTHSTWASLAFQPHFTATAGNVGYGYWSHDIGGHQPGEVEPELYTRWVQWGALSPILRTHGTKNPLAERRIWAFPNDYFHAMRAAFHLRYALIPYIYTAARECHETGMPLCRPLYYHWPSEDAAYASPGEYMFGDDLLVAPVAKPMSHGTAMTRVWLPAGEWTHWFTGRTYKGPQVITLHTPLDEIPLFARKGAIIPTAPRPAPTGRRPLAPLVLHVFPGADSESFLYEDDGISRGYQEGACAFTTLANEREGAMQRITIGPAEGDYPGMARLRPFEVWIREVWPPRAIRINGQPVRRALSAGASGWDYIARDFSAVVLIDPQPASEPIVIEIDLDIEAEAALREGIHHRIRRVLTALSAIQPGAGGLPNASGDFLPKVESAEEAARLRDGILMLHMDLVDPVTRANALVRLTPAALMPVLGAALRLAPDDNARAALMSRFLDLNVSLDVDGSEAGALRITTRLSMNEDAGAIPVHLRVDRPAGWSPEASDADAALELRCGAPLALSRLYRPDGGLHTTHVAIDAEFTVEGFAARFPLGRDILPSINRWLVCGPFDNPWEQGLDRKFGPETSDDVSATYAGKDGRPACWHRVERTFAPGVDLTREFFVDLNVVFGERLEDALAHALCWLEAPQEMDVVLAVGSDDGVAVELNGQRLHTNHVGRAYVSRSDRVPMRLSKGRNRLLLKISQGKASWAFCAHLELPDGRPATSVEVLLDGA